MLRAGILIMTRLGVTFSEEVSKAWDSISRYVDVIEVSNLNDLKHVKGNWTYHFTKSKNGESINLLEPEKVVSYFNSELNNMFKKRPPEMVSVHLGFPTEVYKKDAYDFPTTKPVNREQAIEKFSESLDCLKESLDVPLAIENLDYSGLDSYRYVWEPGFISDVLNRNDEVHLLLDVCHAEVSASRLFGSGPEDRLESTRKYLSRLPLDKTIEIHLNSPVEHEVRLADTKHLPITDIELTLLKELLILPRLDLVNLECKDKIIEQIDTLYPIISQV